MARWTLLDPATEVSWVFPRNPNAMTSPHPPRNHVIFSRGVGGGTGVSRVIAFRQEPYEWSFSGDIRTEAHLTAFQAWTARTGRLHVTDHLGRTWEVRIDSVDLDELPNSPRNSWRFSYTVKTIIYGRVS